MCWPQKNLGNVSMTLINFASGKEPAGTKDMFDVFRDKVAI